MGVCRHPHPRSSVARPGAPATRETPPPAPSRRTPSNDSVKVLQRHCVQVPNIPRVGIFKRQAAQPTGAFWKYVRIAPDERPIDYASLRCVSGKENLPGTLFITNRRLVWMAGDPKRPLGGFEAPLDDVLGCGPIEGVSDPGSFLVGLSMGGKNGVFLFYPQHPGSKANVELAELMHASIGNTLSEHWQAGTTPDAT